MDRIEQIMKDRIEQMNKFIYKSELIGAKLFDFYIADEFALCLMEIYVPKNSPNPKPEIKIPSFVTYLHYSVICENKDLKICKVFIPKECRIEWNYGCWEIGRKQNFFKSANEIIIEEGHQEFFWEDGVLFNGDKTNLFLYPAEKKDEEYTIPKSVVCLEVDAFLENKYLHRLNISKKVRTIEMCEFGTQIHIEVDADNKSYKSINGSLYSKNGKTVYHLTPDEKGNIQIAEGAVSIKDIYLTEEIEALYLPKSIKPRNGSSFIKKNYNMCKRVVVPNELKKYLKSYEKDIGIMYY